MRDVIIFKYERGSEEDPAKHYSVLVTVHTVSGAMSFHKEAYPTGCNVEIKRAFLAEAEKATLVQLVKLEDAGKGFCGY